MIIRLNVEIDVEIPDGLMAEDDNPPHGNGEDFKIEGVTWGGVPLKIVCYECDWIDVMGD